MCNIVRLPFGLSWSNAFTSHSAPWAPLVILLLVDVVALLVIDDLHVLGSGPVLVVQLHCFTFRTYRLTLGRLSTPG